jgi:hypothetical protein
MLARDLSVIRIYVVRLQNVYSLEMCMVVKPTPVLGGLRFKSLPCVQTPEGALLLCNVWMSRAHMTQLQRSVFNVT